MVYIYYGHKNVKICKTLILMHNVYLRHEKGSNQTIFLEPNKTIMMNT